NDSVLSGIGKDLGNLVNNAYENLAFDQACESVLTLVRTCNKYIDDQAPWSLYKQGQIETVSQILYSVLESVRLSAYLLAPIIPNISTAIYQQLGYDLDFNTVSAIALDITNHSNWGVLPADQVLGKAQPVFQRLEQITV
ncbi:MAG: class I tRNA ligase family protein, partial [Planktothrix sp.]